ncbi:hypothetical protein BpOF4_17075 [Alkalihalophilus pseudofirmus OF4]|uniref:DUF3221 domain-containing protein n=1 Tax=Alkalihalophilus pseudofirmus (strain ATCC BAA-2126 / JCM 17055 / OF4) TaxID=398511 RepID=D3FQT8_ALKPO|nr:DUF3221 domain-containing protein [Alkalihalophilus pseudofirmus]ADC51458.1 hypothetical protein BpOF4_17075 [Alkalihalophilus pseudofirmus OF4]
MKRKVKGKRLIINSEKGLVVFITKRFILLSFILTVVIITACNSGEHELTGEASFTGTIESIHNDSAIIAIEEGEILSSGDKVSVNLSLNEEDTFAVGDRVVVEYDGAVMESYPLQVHTISIKLIN